MLIAQLSDLHLRANPPAYSPVDTTACLQRCVDHLRQHSPAIDAVVLSGDLTDTGSEADYHLLRELLEPLACPVWLMAGNHDDRDNLRRVFHGPRHAYLNQHATYVQYAVTAGELRLLALDSVVPGQGHGALCPERLAWLREQLSRQRNPTVVMVHHPPFATGMAEMDTLRLVQGADELDQLLQCHPHVQALWCGHLHRATVTRFGGTVATSAPGTAHQIPLDLHPEQAARFVLEPSGYHLHRWMNGHLVTHQVVAGDFGPWYDFSAF